jgi:hypothetical protein
VGARKNIHGAAKIPRARPTRHPDRPPGALNREWKDEILTVSKTLGEKGVKSSSVRFGFCK